MESQPKFYLPNVAFGNQLTLINFLRSLDIELVVESVDVLTRVENEAVIIPGNGNWHAYLDSGLIDLVKRQSSAKFIGICGGMQIFFESSDEAEGKGAGIFAGKSVKLNSVVPRLGLEPVSDGNHYYFANTFGVVTQNIFENALTYEVNKQAYLGYFNCNRFAGFQFHPEVSGPTGRNIFRKLLDGIKKKNA